MRRRKRLLVLDLSSNSNDTDSAGNVIPNFVLKDPGGGPQYSFGSSTLEKVNRKERPSYLVIRLDTAKKKLHFWSFTDGSSTTRKKGLITTNPNFWRSLHSMVQNQSSMCLIMYIMAMSFHLIILWLILQLIF